MSGKHEVRLRDRSAIKSNSNQDDSEKVCSLNDNDPLQLFSPVRDSCNIMEQKSIFFHLT